MLDALARVPDWLAGDGEVERRAILAWARGQMLTRAKRHEAALAALTEADTLLAESAAAMNVKLAETLYDLSSSVIWPDEARSSVPSALGLQACRLAVRRDSRNGSAWYNLGVSLADAGEHEQAIEAYQRAIAIEKRATRYHGLGNVYRDQGRYDAAIAAHQQAVALNPKDAAPHNGLGIVYRAQGRYEAAIAAYQQAVALDPKDAVTIFALAGAYRQAGDEAAYRRQVEVARPLVADVSVYNRACFAAICDEVEEALALLAQAITEAPGRRTLAQRDPDFAFIRDDPRFRALVGG